MSTKKPLPSSLTSLSPMLPFFKNSSDIKYCRISQECASFYAAPCFSRLLCGTCDLKILIKSKHPTSGGAAFAECFALRTQRSAGPASSTNKVNSVRRSVIGSDPGCCVAEDCVSERGVYNNKDEINPSS